MSGCACGGKRAPMGATSSDPIQNITGVGPDYVASGNSASSLLPYVAVGGLIWFFFMRKKRRR